MAGRARSTGRRNDFAGAPGFTLIEVLIVVIVLGILAAIVILGLRGATGQSAVAACNSDARNVGIAVSAYEAHNGGNPPGGISALLSASNGGPYLKSAPSIQYYIITLDSTGNVLVSLASGTDGATPPAALTQAAVAALPTQNAGLALSAGSDVFTGITTDFGFAWKTGGSAVVPLVAASQVGAIAEPYEGPNAFAWSNVGAGFSVPTTPTNYVGQNICAGA